jgi:hypothetical protein
MAPVISLSSRALQFFAGTFGLFHAILGFLNLPSYEFQAPIWLALIMYIVALFTTVFYWKELKVPSWIASMNLVVAAMLPILAYAALGSFPATPATSWFAAAIGTLLAITAVRGHKVVAWIGVGFLILEVLAWGGQQVLFNSGLIGAVVIVLGAQAASSALATAAQLVEEFRERALSTAAATAAKSAARAERETRIKQTLAGVLPQLEDIVSKQGEITEAQKQLAVLTEAALRDGIRGRNLYYEPLNQEVRLARTRGVEVQLLDDGGLDDLEEIELTALLDRVTSELKQIQAGRVVIRSVAGESWRLSMAAIRKGADQPDLFLRL